MQGKLEGKFEFFAANQDRNRLKSTSRSRPSTLLLAGLVRGAEPIIRCAQPDLPCHLKNRARRASRPCLIHSLHGKHTCHQLFRRQKLALSHVITYSSEDLQVGDVRERRKGERDVHHSPVAHEAVAPSRNRTSEARTLHPKGSAPPPATFLDPFGLETRPQKATSLEIG